jgi:hypothetical protein
LTYRVLWHDRLLDVVFGPDGSVIALTSGGLVRVDLASGTTEPFGDGDQTCGVTTRPSPAEEPPTPRMGRRAGQ